MYTKKKNTKKNPLVLYIKKYYIYLYAYIKNKIKANDDGAVDKAAVRQ